MQRTFVLVLANREGSFLEADRVIAGAGLDITRASYNKVIDVHTVFVEVVGTPDQMAAAEAGLRELGVLPDQQKVGQVFLVEFDLPDVPGAFAPILEAADRHGLNITYFNAKSRRDDPATQVLRVGLYAHALSRLDGFLADVRQVCDAHVIDYDKNESIIDTSLFYLGFARRIKDLMGLTDEQENEILVNTNRIVQNLEHTNNDPFKPVNYVGMFAEGIQQYKGLSYREATRVTRFETPGGVRGSLVEPPAGSDTWVLECDDRLLVVDTGYACYHDELLEVLRDLYPDWDARRRDLLLTHADVDHVGCCDIADHVWCIDRTLEHFLLQAAGEPDWRYRVNKYMPYVVIGDILTGYTLPDLDSFESLGRRPDDDESPLARVVAPTGEPATLDVAPFCFEVWEGAGGHVLGETVLVDRAQRVCVSGDILVNVHGETKPQSHFNSLAPFLMTSVDSDPRLARRERTALKGLLGPGEWLVLPGHGSPMKITC